MVSVSTHSAAIVGKKSLPIQKNEYTWLCYKEDSTGKNK
jgi:hypothetical protein